MCLGHLRLQLRKGHVGYLEILISFVPDEGVTCVAYSFGLRVHVLMRRQDLEVLCLSILLDLFSLLVADQGVLQAVVDCSLMVIMLLVKLRTSCRIGIKTNCKLGREVELSIHSITTTPILIRVCLVVRRLVVFGLSDVRRFSISRVLAADTYSVDADFIVLS